jgi:CSLREA domain-containing protein
MRTPARARVAPAGRTSFSGADGTLLHELISPNEEESGYFGNAVAGVPDVDGDGRGDLLVGAYFEEPYGRAYVFSGGVALAADPLALHFGNVAVGSAATQAVTLRNVNGSAVTVTALTLAGDDAGQFEVVSAPPLPLLLQPGESATVSVRFTPTEAGTFEAALVAENDAMSRVVPLLGAGAVRQALTVTTTADSDGVCDADCSLREAILAANATPGADEIRFASALTGQTITLTQPLGQLLVTDDVRIDADGQDVTVDANGTYRAFQIGSSGNQTLAVELLGLTIRGADGGQGAGIQNYGRLTLTRCTVRHNRIPDYAKYGGAGIRNEPGAVLSVVESTIRDNVVGEFNGNGGGLLNVEGTVTIIRSTLSGNRIGAGLDYTVQGLAIASAGGTLTLVESTVSGNEGVGGQNGSRIAVAGYSGGTVTLLRSAVTGNDDGLGGDASTFFFIEGSLVAGNDDDCSFVARGESRGYNVTGPDCRPVFGSGPGDVTVARSDVYTLVLDPALRDNGGPTLTHALHYRPDNPALDIGGTCEPLDQRGLPALLDGPDPEGTAACDAGAVEADVPTLSVVLVPEGVPPGTPVVIPPSGGTVTFTATLTNTTTPAGGTQPLTFQAWTAAVTPEGAAIGPLVGPVTVALDPGQSLTRTLTQTVPASAPAGTYRYVAYTGVYPDGPVDGASFAVVKEGETGRVGAGRWPQTVGWPVEDGVVQANAAGMPEAFALHVPRPNPFASRTVLGYDLPQASRVRLIVYDVLGRAVAVLVDAEVEAGRHEAALDGRLLPSGSYLVRLEAGGAVQTRRVTLVR